MERRSVADYLEHFLRHESDCAYVQRRGYRSERWSYRKVAETSFQFARELEARGISKGERVLIWGPNCAEWVAAFFGCALRGVVVVPMDRTASPDFALRVAQQVSAKLVLCSSEHSVLFPKSIIIGDLVPHLSEQSRDRHPAGAISTEDILQIVFTSGTTAEPKGVVITHGNVLGNIAPLETEIQKHLKYERFVHPIRFLNLLPLSHVFGQFLGIYLPQLLGGTVVFQDTLKPAEVIGAIRRERISVLVAVPRMLQSLKETIAGGEEERGTPSQFRTRFESASGKHFLRRWWTFRRIHRQFGWKFWAFISGGAALDASTEEFWRRLGYAVIQGYGLTETTSLISLNHPFRTGKGSIGKVLNGREVKLAEDGEILVRGSGVTSGYWSGTDLKPATDDEGWYRTGDVGELDAQGNLYFKGRKKDVIVTAAGMNVYPEDLEAALRRQPEVQDCVVIGLPRNGNSEACAVLILRDREDAQAVVSRANLSLAEYQRVQHWFVWPDKDFPRTSTQKPRTNEIRQAVLSHSSGGPLNAGGGPLNAVLVECGISKHISNFSVPNAHLNLDFDLNLSSLDRVELLSALEERYQIDLSETRFAAVKTVGDLQNILQSKIPARVVYHYPAWVLRWPSTWIRLLVHYVLLRPSVFLLGWPRVIGREHLQEIRGPFLVVCNHLDDVDVGFVHTALPAHIRHKLATATGGEALEILRTPPLDRNPIAKIYDRIKWALGVSLLNLFPLPREAGFRQSFAYAGQCVDRGYSVLIFPEGRHTTTGKINPFRSGIGLLVKNLLVPVIPMRIDGLFELKQAGRKFARPYQITVRIGKPVQFPPESDPESIARELQKTVEAL